MSRRSSALPAPAPQAPAPTGLAEAVARGIAGELPRLSPLVLHWIRPRPGLEPPPQAHASVRPRLTIVCAGERRVLAQGRGELTLRRGHGLVVAANGWSMPLPSPPHRFIALSCDHDSTQFTHEGIGLPGTGVFHAPGPLPTAAGHLLDALLQLEAAPPALAQRVLRCAVEAALPACRTPRAAVAPGLIAWARARAYAREHLHAGRDALAAAAGVHPNHLSRLCRRAEGVGLIAWLTGLRLAQARELLWAGMPPEQVAQRCGYAEGSHFRRQFRRHLGMPPLRWLATMRQRGESHAG
jgi:AraC-like DNA-binding protein